MRQVKHKQSRERKSYEDNQQRSFGGRGNGTCKGPVAGGTVACCRNRESLCPGNTAGKGSLGGRSKTGVKGLDYITPLGHGKDFGSSLSEMRCYLRTCLEGRGAEDMDEQVLKVPHWNVNWYNHYRKQYGGTSEN